MSYLSTQLANNMSVPSLIITAVVSFLAALYIFYIYKRTYSGVLYNRSMSISFLMITLVVTFIIRFIGMDPVLSLGMVGAVSIVRYRTAVKDSMDNVFLFWAAAEGIVIGSQNKYIILGVVSTLIIGVVIFAMSLFKGTESLPFMLIVRHDFNSTAEVGYALRRLPRNALVKSRTVTQSGVEVIVEMRLPANNPALVDSFSKINGVFDAQLVELHTDYTSV